MARIVLAVLALVVCAWFALGVRQSRDVSEASAIIASAGQLSAQQAARADSLLRSAATLNPDLQVDVLRGQLALREHDRAGAARILTGVVRREPMNLLGWVFLAQAAQSRQQLDLAITNIGRLHPGV